MQIITGRPLKGWKIALIDIPGKPPKVFTGFTGDLRVHPNGSCWALLGFPGASIEYSSSNLLIEGDFLVSDYGRGRSSATFTLSERTTGYEFQVGMDGMFGIWNGIQRGTHCLVDGGHIRGRFTFAKQGQQIYMTRA